MSFARFNESFDVVFFCNGNEYGMGEYFKDLNPIPLTEEWLLKFGLTKTNGGNFSCNDICVYDNLENINISLENGDISVELRCPKYIHQLQNLYFALTGEELETKSINTQNK